MTPSETDQGKDQSANKKLLAIEAPLRDAFAAACLLEYAQAEDFATPEWDAISIFLRREARQNLRRALAVLDQETQN